jgi:PQQ-dependent dehydrogenase (methanol/ethanol family)
MPQKIFLSYRREDAQDAAARLHTGLAKTFGARSVFMDVDNLLAGQRFDRELEKALGESDIFVAVIGPRWLSVLNERTTTGERDYVREEISRALHRDIYVVPVLVNNAQLPRENELPEDIRELVKYQKHDVRHEHFQRDVTPLIDAIRTLRRPVRRGLPWRSLLTGGAVAAGAAAVAVFGPPDIPWPQWRAPDLAGSDASTAGAAPPAPAEDRVAMTAEEPAVVPPKPKPPASAAKPIPAAEWTMPTGDYANQRFSKLDQINTGNAGSLRQAWTFSTGVLRGHQGSPLVIGDTMYLVTPFPNNVFALDLSNDGAVKWKYQPKMDPSVIPVMCCDTVNRGVAYSDGTIYLHQADTSLVALDQKTGREIWKAINGDPRRGETGTNAPIVIKDTVIVGMSGGEFGNRGHITAYDKDTGKRKWRAYTTGPDSDILFDPQTTLSLGRPVGRDSSLKTWTGDQWKIGGGTAWGWFSYDPDLDLMYYGTGNPSTWNASQRAGPDGRQIDHRWTTSIIARDPQTGVAAWAYQMTPFDEWSYDGVNEMILADVKVGGKTRQALVHFDKNGFAYTLDRRTGEPLVAEKFLATTNWASAINLDKSSRLYGRPLVVASKSTFLNGADVNSKEICPSSSGAKNQGPAAFSPLTSLFYVPVNSLCMDYEPFKVSYTPGQPYVGATLSMFPGRGDSSMGAFLAWDASAGKAVWETKEEFPVWSGALTTAGGLVCYGTMDGYLKCLDQKNGKELFKYRTPSGIVGNVMTYAHGGKQYISVLSGVGGWAAIGLAAGLDRPTDGLGMVGPMAGLASRTSLGGAVVTFALP